jgi:general secretion pathway protein K
MRACERQGGAALLIVMWTFAVLAALAGEFAIAMRREAESTRNFKQEAVARYTAFAGLNEAILAISSFNGELGYDEEEERLGDRLGETDDEEGDGLDLIRTLIEGRGEWVKGRLDAASYEEYEVRAVDETGKIPLNASAVDETLLRQIMLNLGYEELEASTVADSILDWRDEDDLHRGEGAEDDYYEDLQRPYPCKDAPLDALEELLLVRGVTRAMFYGVGDTPALRDIFTVAHDRSRLTIRTVSPEVEWALCGDPEDRGVDEDHFSSRTGDQQVLDVQTCLEGSTLGVRRGEAQGRPQLGFAMVEARVIDPQDEKRVVAHIGAQVQFKGRDDGFQTVQWYDSIFDE